MTNENPSGQSKTTDTVPASWTRMALVAGFVLLSLGAWLLLDSMGVGLPGLGRHWPLFVLLGGVASLLDFLVISRRPGALGLGVLGVGLGLVAYCLSLGYIQLTAIDDWGPAVPLFVGLAFVATWYVSEVKNNAQLALGAAGIGMALVFWGWQMVRLEVVWGIGLLAVGGFFVWKALGQRAKG